MKSLLVCENLVIGYPNKALLDPLNLTLERGEYLCIVGGNGSGKSTFVKTILGLNKPLAGHYKWQTNNGYAYLPQEKKYQSDFPATVKEIVLSGALKQKGLWPFYKQSLQAKAKEKMQLLNILALQNYHFEALSGGQKQRVLLARALMASSEVIVLDEPTTGLDQQTENDLYTLLLKLNKEGFSIIMVSHDVYKASIYAHKVLTLNNGKSSLEMRKVSKC